jgi:hypothetical protein
MAAWSQDRRSHDRPATDPVLARSGITRTSEARAAPLWRMDLTRRVLRLIRVTRFVGTR